MSNPLLRKAILAHSHRNQCRNWNGAASKPSLVPTEAMQSFAEKFGAIGKGPNSELASLYEDALETIKEFWGLVRILNTRGAPTYAM